MRYSQLEDESFFLIRSFAGEFTQKAMAAPTLAPVETIRVLLLEDNPADADLCIRTLKTAGLQVDVDVARFSREFRERLGSQTYDIILTDYRLPDWNGLDAFNWLRASGHNTPLVLVTGTLGDEVAIECIKAGSKIALLMPDLPKVRLDSRGCAVYGSCAVCALAWTSRTPPGPVPHSERLYAKGSRSAGIGGV
jgi:CheY-like chemotaxis protein